MAGRQLVYSGRPEGAASLPFCVARPGIGIRGAMHLWASATEPEGNAYMLSASEVGPVSSLCVGSLMDIGTY
jgi:hypothetical protein